MNKINYDLEMQKIIGGFAADEKPSLLLHSCCAPCSTAVVERLIENFTVTVFYFNPNVTESEEYNLRLNEQKRYLKETYGDAVNLIEGRYKASEFFFVANGLTKEPEGGKRCERCFLLRLEETAKVAKEGGYRYFCTTLTVSPHKNADVINEIVLAIFTARAIFLGSSSISTTSPASTAASLPSPPMAMPTSARFNTGASLMPSPT